LSGLVPGHTYTFAVYAHNEYGYGAAAISNTIVLPGPPPAVTAVKATAGSKAGTVKVTWKPPTTGSPDSYMVQVFDVASGFVTQRTVVGTSTELTGLTPGRSYSFAVYAHNIYGYGPPAASNTVLLPGGAKR
jgi:hypothetical protein